MPEVKPIIVHPTGFLTENSTPEVTVEANVAESKFMRFEWLSKLVVSNINANSDLVTGVKYQDLDQLVPQSDAEYYGDYRLTSVSERYAGYFTLTFARHKSDALKLTPYSQTPTFGNHYWCPVLEALVFIEDYTFPRATNGGSGGKTAIITGPTYYSREVYKPSISEGSRFIKQEYFADTPFLIPSFQVPVPASVSYDLPGLRGSFPECLHPKLIIPDTQTANASFVIGNKSAASGALSGQKFPATNFTERRPYVVGVDQKFANGGWYMAQITVIPPLDGQELIVK